MLLQQLPVATAALGPETLSDGRTSVPVCLAPPALLRHSSQLLPLSDRTPAHSCSAAVAPAAVVAAEEREHTFVPARIVLADTYRSSVAVAVAAVAVGNPVGPAMCTDSRGCPLPRWTAGPDAAVVAAVAVVEELPNICALQSRLAVAAVDTSAVVASVVPVESASLDELVSPVASVSQAASVFPAAAAALAP